MPTWLLTGVIDWIIALQIQLVWSRHESIGLLRYKFSWCGHGMNWQEWSIGLLCYKFSWCGHGMNWQEWSIGLLCYKFSSCGHGMN